MATKNICVRFHGFPVKTVGGDRFLAKKVPKNGTLIALAVEPVDLLKTPYTSNHIDLEYVPNSSL